MVLTNNSSVLTTISTLLLPGSASLTIWQAIKYESSIMRIKFVFLNPYDKSDYQIFYISWQLPGYFPFACQGR